jgi:hypothetical protein
MPHAINRKCSECGLKIEGTNVLGIQLGNIPRITVYRDSCLFDNYTYVAFTFLIFMKVSKYYFVFPALILLSYKFGL